MAAAMPSSSRRRNSAGAGTFSGLGTLSRAVVTVVRLSLPAIQACTSWYACVPLAGGARMNTVTLPDGPSLPRFVQGGMALAARCGSSATSALQGVIVNTSSVFGLLGMPYQSAYCASKFAVRGFTDALRQELRGTGVSAVTVHPGGIRTNIARNARIRSDPEGRGRTHEQMAAEFEAITMTSPEKAAEIICRGVERGKARILVGPDAYAFDALARIAPTHYFALIAQAEKRLRSRRGAVRP